MAVVVHEPGPRVAHELDDVLTWIESDVAQQLRRIGELRTAISSTAPRAGCPEVEEVHGVDLVRERIAELSFFASSSVCAVQPARTPSPASVAAARPLDARSVRRGLDVRVVHDSAVAADDAAAAHLYALAASGTQVRTAPGPLGRMILLDGRIAVVPLDPGDSAKGAAIVRQPGIVASLASHFERIWGGATDLPDGMPPDTAPDPRDAAVLRLLAEGCTDEVVARRVGMSGRGVRRRMAQLMDELGAGSRFAAGVAAARRGWI